MRALVVDDEIVALKALTRRIQWEKIRGGSGVYRTVDAAGAASIKK